MAWLSLSNQPCQRCVASGRKQKEREAWADLQTDDEDRGSVDRVAIGMENGEWEVAILGIEMVRSFVFPKRLPLMSHI